MTYANHGATENTEATRRSSRGFVNTKLGAFSVNPVSLWLPYVNKWRVCGT